ncbi:hypothetical protein [Azospirillum sp. sgz302134]
MSDIACNSQTSLRAFPWRRSLSAASALAIALASFWLIAVYGSLGRPIWIDEFLHFALGASRSVHEALAVIHETTKAVNHGQTGAYMLLDYALLQAFGASAFALRLPSLLSGVLLLAAAFLFFRARKVGVIGTVAFLLAVAGQPDLMHYVGEARPYMPLAASVVGVLAYYATPLDERRRWPVAALGWVSVILGASMHPYFPVYWFVLCLFGFWMAWLEGRQTVTLRSAITFANLPLSITGTLLVFGIGAVTWLQGGPSFAFDPFQWLTNGLWHGFTRGSHFQFIPDDVTAVLAVAAACPLLYPVAPRRVKPVLRGLVAASVLILLALAVSVLLGAASYVRHYWILPRQWIASMALVPLGVVWFGCEVFRQLGRVHGMVAVIFALAAVDYLAGTTLPVMQPRAVALRAWASAPTAQAPADAAPVEPAVPTENDGWVSLANRNVEAGGPVWPVFRSYYESYLDAAERAARTN